MGDKRKIQKRILQAAFLLFWVIVASLCIVVTVFSREALSRSEEEAYYQTLEKEMERQVREYLNEQGFQNSGVMLTRVMEADGSREYTLTVHHSRIENLNQEAQDALGAELEHFFFKGENCSLNQRFR
ncbi:MAG: hypothetical protein IJ833_07460 [Lachnospiraceae bacterium]|nr:hypothetical protein [Lachnospiraceae bacterium]